MFSSLWMYDTTKRVRIKSRRLCAHPPHPPVPRPRPCPGPAPPLTRTPVALPAIMYYVLGFAGAFRHSPPPPSSQRGIQARHPAPRSRPSAAHWMRTQPPSLPPSRARLHCHLQQRHQRAQPRALPSFRRLPPATRLSAAAPARPASRGSCVQPPPSSLRLRGAAEIVPGVHPRHGAVYPPSDRAGQPVLARLSGCHCAQPAPAPAPAPRPHQGPLCARRACPPARLPPPGERWATRTDRHPAARTAVV